MLGSPIHATISALRTTLVDLENLAPSAELAQLKRILLLRIAELESLRAAAPAAPEVAQSLAPNPGDPDQA